MQQSRNVSCRDLFILCGVFGVTFGDIKVDDKGEERCNLHCKSRPRPSTS